MSAIDAPPVAVVVSGHLVVASAPARLVRGVVVAPVDPYAYVLARRITFDPVHASVTFECDGKSVTVGVVSLRDGTLVIPLGSTARRLGEVVRYDAAAHVLSIDALAPQPVATLTPFAGYVAPAGPLPTFTPTAAATPRPAVTGDPEPRRTPIVVRQ